MLVNKALAWGYTGHNVINTIAYDHLTPQAREQVDRLIPIMGKDYPASNHFTRAGMWADWIRGDVKTYDKWHYIDQPIYGAGSSVARLKKLFSNDNEPNVVWAINHTKALLQDENISEYEKSKQLFLLVHFIADAHQPLHCATYYSAQFPHGDRGGNSYKINSAYGKNLHQFWDHAGGLFKQYRAKPKIRGLAKQIQQQYPPQYFEELINNFDPTIWCQESYDIAKDFVYSTPYNSRPNNDYMNQTQQLSSQRMALTAYRMAIVLNAIYSDNRY